MKAGSGGNADETLKERGLAVDGVLDIDGVELAIAPFAQVERRLGGTEALCDGGGEEIVPCGVAFGKPAGWTVHDEPLFGVGLVAPGVERRRGDGSVFAFVLGAGLG